MDMNVGLYKQSARFKKKLKDTAHSGKGITSENRQLANKLHRLITKKTEKDKIFLSFQDNIYGSGLAFMKLRSKYNKKIKFLLCGIEVYSKNLWLFLVNENKDIKITNAFQKVE